jgi:hypothetical protein
MRSGYSWIGHCTRCSRQRSTSTCRITTRLRLYSGTLALRYLPSLLISWLLRKTERIFEYHLTSPSALVALYTPTFRLAGTSVSNTEFTPERLSRAFAVCQLVTKRLQIPNFTESICPLTSQTPEEMSPWGCFFAYQVCAVHLRAKQRGGGEEEVVKFFKEAFGVINRGWRAAGEYDGEEWGR